MTQPQGFVDPCFPRHVSRLYKPFYGLKQAPRAWYERFSNGIGFQRTYADYCLLIRFYRGPITILLLHVDDLVITGNDNHYITSLISSLHTTFGMKNSDPLHHFLGVEVNKTVLIPNQVCQGSPHTHIYVGF